MRLSTAGTMPYSMLCFVCGVLAGIVLSKIVRMFAVECGFSFTNPKDM